MKLLLINSVCGIGSTGKIVTRIADDYISQGHEARIAYGRSDVFPEQYRAISYRIGSAWNVKLHALCNRLFDNHGFCSNRATKEFLSWANEYNPDVLWLHNLHGYYINIEKLFSWIKSRPQMQVKWTLHDCWAFTGHCSHFDFCGCEKWKTQCCNCPRTKEYPSSLLMDNSADNYARKRKAFTGVAKMEIIAPSRWLAGLVKESFLKEYTVTVVPNTIHTSIFKPTPSDFRAKYGLENKTIILGVANVWSKLKGLHDFVKLRALLDDSFHIVLVGLTPKQIRELPKGITGITRTNSASELAAIYTAADAFFNPTYQDNYPTVNIESEACGTPVITYNTGGSPETIKSDASIIVSKGDLDEAIHHILKHGKYSLS